jgi:gliding motility-associated-like protein
LGDELETLIQIYGGVGEPEFMWYLNGVPFNDTLNFRIPTDFAYNYNLEFRTTDECSNTESDYFSYSVVDCIKPNVFTPNADGENDFFYINFGDVVTNVRLNVYNRWGQEVYTSINYELCDQETGAKCWNGLDMSTNDFCPEGSYFYTIEMLDGRKNKGFTSIYRD